MLLLVQFGLLGGNAFGRWLLTRLAVCSLYVLAVYGFDCFSFWFGAGFVFWLLRFLDFAYFLLSLMRISYSKQICLAHTLFFNFFTALKRTTFHIFIMIS